MREEIKTARLLLRRFRESDYDDLFEFLSQLEDDEFEGYSGITYDNGREHLRQRLGSEEFYAVVLPDSGKVIGNIYCGARDFAAKEVGYIINKDYQRQGCAAEALSAVIRSAFQEGVHRAYAECDPRNTASWKLLESVGFRREAHLRQNVFSRKMMTVCRSGKTPMSMRSWKATKQINSAVNLWRKKFWRQKDCSCVK